MLTLVLVLKLLIIYYGFNFSVYFSIKYQQKHTLKMEVVYALWVCVCRK